MTDDKPEEKKPKRLYNRKGHPGPRPDHWAKPGTKIGTTRTKWIGKLDYKEEYCDLLVEHFSEPCSSWEGFAGRLRCALETIIYWEDNHPEFKEARRIATMVNRYVMDKLAHKYIHIPHQGGNFKDGLWLVYMRNIHGVTEAVVRQDTVDTAAKLIINMGG